MGQCEVEVSELDLGGEVSTCASSYTLHAGDGFDGYLWNTGETSASIEVDDSGFYSVETSTDIDPVEGSLWFNGSSDHVWVNATNNNFPTRNQSRTVMFWVKTQSDGNSFGNVLSYGWGCPDCNNLRFSVAIRKIGGWDRVSVIGQGNDYHSDHNLQLGVWTHVAVVYDSAASQLRIYVNGQLTDTSTKSYWTGVNSPLRIAKNTYDRNDEYFKGTLANVQLRSVALGTEAIANHMACALDETGGGMVGNWLLNEPIGGSNQVCDWSDQSYVSGSSGQFQSNGPTSSCTPVTQQEGVHVEFLSMDALGVCGGSCVADVDEDGICDDVDDCVGTFDACGVCNGPGEIYECGCSDILEGDCDCDGNQLDALGVCGGGCTIDLNNDGVCDCDPDPWGCGDPLEYQGYLYATVDIDGQCWFAENLRNQAYANGDSILANWSDADWAYPYDANDNAIGGARVYGESDNCSSYLDGFDVCASPELSLEAYGRMYNWHAVNDSRNLCPSGWHVPSSDDWMMLTDHLGGAQAAGPSLRSSTGWYGNTGTNSSGFSALPGGSVTPESVFNHSGTQSYWWTSTWNSQVPSGVGCDACPEFRSMTWHGAELSKWWLPPEYGFSVRCIHSDSVAESQGECNCADIAEGDCDCNGNDLDALGVCGGDCAADVDADGICDDVDDCVGAFDACGVCNGPGEIYECGCTDIPEGDCDCEGNELDAIGVCGGECSFDSDGDGICDCVVPLGSGTQADPYVITCLGELDWVSQNPSTWSSYFVLAQDIDASQTQYWDDADDDGDGLPHNDPNDFT
ncbi:MAG: FISUMP domain-containing protein, partial [Flavobacteriales bacterium]